MSRKSWRRRWRSGPPKIAKAPAVLLSEEKNRLERLLKARPDFEALEAAAVTVEQQIGAICNNKDWQERRFFSSKIWLKKEAVHKISTVLGYEGYQYGIKHELNWFQKWYAERLRRGESVWSNHWEPLEGDKVSCECWVIGVVREFRDDINPRLEASRIEIEASKTKIAALTRDIIQAQAKQEEKARRFQAKQLEEARVFQAKQLEKARIAALLDRARGGAQAIIPKLPRDHQCPYCGGPLGNSPHADHIHPVAKGGLSTWQNMVYICMKCNIKKSHATLTAFAAKEGRDLTAILARLRTLGKEF